MLVNSYLKILLFSIIIDGSIDIKEVKALFSLFTRVDMDNENIVLEKFNFLWEKKLWKNKSIDFETTHFDYVRVLTLENIIFYEWEKSLAYLFEYLERKNTLSFEEKMEELDKHLLNLKTIIDQKANILWRSYIKLFYYGLYYYVEVITKQAWRFLEWNIVKEEKAYLSKINSMLEVNQHFSKIELHKINTPTLDL